MIDASFIGGMLRYNNVIKTARLHAVSLPIQDLRGKYEGTDEEELNELVSGLQVQ
jgi:hypothetical protein